MSDLEKRVEALKPCPFCGAEAEQKIKVGIIDGERSVSAVYCMKCGGSGAYAEIQDHAIESWNRRALLAESREGEKPSCEGCGGTGKIHFTGFDEDCRMCGGSGKGWTPPASAGTEGPGLMEILRKWQVAFDHFLADPGQFLDVFKEPIRLTQLALAARPVEGEKK